MDIVNQKYLRYEVTKGYSKLKAMILRRLYRDKVQDPTKSILVVGTARSGTSWIADLIASQFKSRIMFEPFNPELVPEYRKFNYFQYMRPEDHNPDLYCYCRKVFAGAIRNGWIDREIQHLYPHRRIIKCIRASLMLKWLDNQFPEVPNLLIVRHPCAVVLSRMKLGWATDDDIHHFLIQPDLMSDFLEEKIEIVTTAKSDQQKHALIWCITNLVPLRQFRGNQLNIVFYEKLVQNPEEEIPKIFNVFNLPYEQKIFDRLNRPSMTSLRSSAVITGDHRVDQWKDELSSKQIDNILSIVYKMGLAEFVEAAFKG
ncbi:MAG: sulfotransferase [Anaerolineales bacterium]